MNWAKRIDRLARLQEWAQQERDQVFAQLQALEQQRQSTQAQVEQLQAYRADYLQNSHQEVKFVSQLLAQNSFVERINQAIEATEQKIPPIEQQMVGLRSVLAEKQQRVKLLSILNERWFAKQQSLISRQEQQMLDEWVMQQNSQNS
jgi:flagellar export protein FliJ